MHETSDRFDLVEDGGPADLTPRDRPDPTYLECIVCDTIGLVEDAYGGVVKCPGCKGDGCTEVRS